MCGSLRYYAALQGEPSDYDLELLDRAVHGVGSAGSAVSNTAKRTVGNAHSLDAHAFVAIFHRLRGINASMPSRPVVGLRRLHGVEPARAAAGVLGL